MRAVGAVQESDIPEQRLSALNYLAKQTCPVIVLVYGPR
jgi:hypothetical protein